MGSNQSKSIFGVISIAVTATALLSACTSLATNLDSLSTDPSENAASSQSTDYSEQEACGTVVELMQLAQRMYGGDGAQFSEVNSKLLHLAGVQAILADGESSLVSPLASFANHFSSTLPMLAIPQPPISELKSNLEKLTTDLGKLDGVCTNVGTFSMFPTLPLSVANFFPNGFWNRSLDGSYLIYSLASDDDLHDIEIANGEPIYSPNGRVGSRITFVCDFNNEIFGVAIGRNDGHLNDKPLRGSGEVAFWWSVDGGPKTLQRGVIENGLLYPFLESWTNTPLRGQGWRALTKVAIAGETVELKLEPPGDSFTAVFSTIGFDQVIASFDSFGCLDF